MMKTILCMDWGGTFIKYAFLNEECSILLKGKVESPKKSDSIEVLMDCIENIVKLSPNIDGIGISSAGIIDSENGIVESIGIFPFLDHVNVCALLEEKYHVKVTIENDARCALLAEVWKGNLSHVKDGAVVVLGTGIGSALWLDGKVHRGFHHLSGEVCASCIDISKKEDRMSYVGQHGTTYLCILVSKEMHRTITSGEEVFQLVQEGNEDALRGLQAYTDDLALILFNMFVLLDVEKICIGGGISCQPMLMKCLQESIQKIRTYHPDIVQGMEYPLPIVDTCKYYNEANLIGALFNWLKTW